jgi:4-carboxymuconolactone decarboxylase
MWNERADLVSTAGIESIVDATVTRWFTPRFADEDPGRIEAVRTMVRRTSNAGYVGHARAFTTIDWSGELEQIDVPTLLVSAAGDPGGGRSDVMQSMADSMRRATHVAVPDAGHICNIENPTAFNAIVVEFIRRYSTASRLGPVLPGQLNEAQRSLYDTITHGPRSTGPQRHGLASADGALVGPFNAMLLSPPVGMAVQTLGAALRFESVLTDRQRELAILLVAASWTSTFERTAHEAIGRLVGLTDDEIDQVSRGEAPCLADEHERAAVAFVGHLLTRGNVDDSQYVEAVSALGTRRVYELATIVGHYSLLALNLRVFEGESPPS